MSAFGCLAGAIGQSIDTARLHLEVAAADQHSFADESCSGHI